MKLPLALDGARIPSIPSSERHVRLRKTWTRYLGDTAIKKCQPTKARRVLRLTEELDNNVGDDDNDVRLSITSLIKTQIHRALQHSMVKHIQHAGEYID